jgi:hypothetical protein
MQKVTAFLDIVNAQFYLHMKFVQPRLVSLSKRNAVPHAMCKNTVYFLRRYLHCPLLDTICASRRSRLRERGLRNSRMES